MMESNAGTRLKELAKELGITQKQLAKSLDITPQYIITLASGKNNISRKLAQVVQDKYNINSDWIMTGEGNKYIDTNNKISRSNKDELLSRILSMSETDIAATLAFIKQLDEINKDRSEKE